MGYFFYIIALVVASLIFTFPQLVLTEAIRWIGVGIGLLYFKIISFGKRSFRDIYQEEKNLSYEGWQATLGCFATIAFVAILLVTFAVIRFVLQKKGVI